jgi:7-cyano-7-deazaguanine synthase
MSGIYGALVTHCDGGVRGDNVSVMRCATVHGEKPSTTTITNGEIEEKANITHHASYPREGPLEYAFLGSVGNAPLVIHDRFVVVWDGPLSEQDVYDAFLSHDFASLNGNFSLAYISLDKPDRISFYTRAKPLYVLADAIGRCVRIVSDDYWLEGMYHKVRNPRPLELGPYTAGYVTNLGLLDRWTFQREQSAKELDRALLLCGGGLDSLVSAYSMSLAYKDLTLLHVDYGCRAERQEWNATLRIGPTVGAKVVRLTLPPFLNGSLSAVGPKVEKEPTRGVAHEWMPGRNSLLMAIALSYAEAHGIYTIGLGINGQAADAYPDNTLEWLKKWSDLIPYSINTTSGNIHVLAPLGGMTKTGIVKLGQQISVNWNCPSWSCYEGGEMHCGKCSSCRARRDAFKQAKVFDPTSYAED